MAWRLPLAGGAPSEKRQLSAMLTSVCKVVTSSAVPLTG